MGQWGQVMEVITKLKGSVCVSVVGILLSVSVTAGQTIAKGQDDNKVRHRKAHRQVNKGGRTETTRTARQERTRVPVRGNVTRTSEGANHGQEVSSERLAAIEAWKASGRKGPPPWAGVGGGPGGNPNHPGQGHEIGRGHGGGPAGAASRGRHHGSDGETPATEHGQGSGR